MNQSKKQEIRACTFEMQVTQGTGNIKFPCFCYVEWKTNNDKDVIKSPNRVKLLQGKLAFNQKLALTTPIIYDLSLQAYSKKQSVVILNLLSNSRPNEPKLVGRVSIQLSSVANSGSFGQVKQYPLQFCSVDATLTFRVVLKEYAQTNLAVSDLERSQFSEFEPLVAERQTAKEDTKSESGARSISSVNISQNPSNRLNRDKPLQNQPNYQDRVNQIMAGNQQPYNIKLPQGYTKFKREAQSINSNLGASRQQRIRQYNQQRQLKSLNNDFSVPILTKNSDEFDSNKISEKTIPNPGKSEKQMLLDESPNKNSQKIIKQSNQSMQDKFHSIRNGQFSHKVVEQSSNIPKYQQQISSLKSEVQNLTADNSHLLKQLESKHSDLASLKAENAQHKETVAKLNKQIIKKDKELHQFSQLNYPALVEQLNRSIQQKDREIQSLIASTFETQKTFENKQTQFQSQVQELQNYIKLLEQSNTQKPNQSPKQQISPAKSSNSNHVNSAQKQNFGSKIDDLTYMLQIERKNHENAKIELAQLQQWYKEIQEQSQKLSIENEEFKEAHNKQKVNAEKLRQIIDQLHQQKKIDNGVHIQQKDSQITILTEQSKQLNDQIQSLNQIIKQLKSNNAKQLAQLQKSKKELDDLQSKYVQQEQHLRAVEGKMKQYSNLIDKNKAQMLINTNNAQRKAEQLQDAQRKLSDLIKRMKEKEQNMLKLQRETQQLDSKLKISQSNCEKTKQRVKILENEKNNDQQKIKLLQKQNRLLKSKTEKDQELSNREINKLKQNLQNQNSKKKQLSSMLSEVQNKSKSSESSKIREFQKKINKYMEKQLLLKQQLNLLEQESNKISEILQQKQENQQNFTQTLTILSQQNVILKAKISELQNQSELLNERNQGLQAQIELLNAYQPSEEGNNQIAQLNKRLIEKNKQLLHQIEEKNLLIAEFQKIEGQHRGKQVEQILSTSRITKQRQEYQQRYQQIVDQNEKLYKQFQKLNNKYREEINETSQASEQRIQSLQSKIEQFFGKLTQKDVKYAQLQIKSKEDFERLEQSLHEKQYQVEYYSNEIKQMTITIQDLNQKIGEKQFQLHLAEQKIKQLFENINSLQLKRQEPAPVLSPINHKNEAIQEELDSYKSKIEFYEAQIQRLHEKEFIQEKDLITINEQLTRLKQNGEEQIKHISYLQGQLKNFRERQSQYIQQIDSLSGNQNLFKSRYTRLQKDKNQLYTEIQKLNMEIETLKQNNSQKSQEGTPISKFKESPSPLKLPSVDISDIVGQINTILTRRKQQQELQNALRLVIDNNTRQEQQFERWSRQRGMIQEKAKLASKELQKIKSNIMKTPNKSITQKTQLTNLLKPAETIINQLINLSEHLIQLDPYEEQEEEFENQDQHN